MQRKVISVFLILNVVAGSAFAADNPAEKLANEMVGLWTSIAPNPGGQTLPVAQRRLYLRVARVDAPNLGNIVLYQQVMAGTQRGSVVRQRLSRLQWDDGLKAVIEQRYDFRSPQFYIDGDYDPSLFPALGLDGVMAWPAGCNLLWQSDENGNVGTVSGRACQQIRADGVAFYVQSRISLKPDRMEISERAYGMDGALLPETADAKPRIWRRIN